MGRGTSSPWSEIRDHGGKKVLVLHPFGGKGYSFGVEKAKLILALVDDIRKFVKQHGRRRNDH